jgi:hypothetical protein
MKMTGQYEFETSQEGTTVLLAECLRAHNRYNSCMNKGTCDSKGSKIACPPGMSDVNLRCSSQPISQELVPSPQRCLVLPQVLSCAPPSGWLDSMSCQRDTCHCATCGKLRIFLPYKMCNQACPLSPCNGNRASTLGYTPCGLQSHTASRRHLSSPCTGSTRGRLRICQRCCDRLFCHGQARPG